MKLFDLTDKEGRAFAFEVENIALGRRGFCRVVQTIPGATLLKTPRLFSWFREETFCIFSVAGATFSAWEPFGDNSRYWVGPEPVGYAHQISLVRAAFEAHAPLLDRPVLSFFKKSRA
ncbi:MAG TPA: hypothetical protein VN693_07445 [Rhodanobacteraceae bacterium]|nr:hypothetical protein [Rhodanobacteraceae bacterium]